MLPDEKDVLCVKLLETLKEIDHMVGSEASAHYFDVERNASSHEKYNELRRLRRSLGQYTDKSGALLYVGFLGHFSAGKSSTINSMLEASGASDARLTGLHPTDKAVTLITHTANSASLIGAHKRGELEVGSSLMEADILREHVIVDTPGTGDPAVIEEMVRDFLPICDLIIYVFSAATPLDKTDLPVLEKLHADLPFIATKIIVTRADEFRREITKPLSDGNFDKAKADTFVAELISRISGAVPGMTITQENILLIDNPSGFNGGKLEEFVFPQIDPQQDQTARLHTAKIAYYYHSAKRIRDFYSDYLEQKASALDSLLLTAKNNHTEYQAAVTIANNKLTESWAKQHHAITVKHTGNTDWVSKLDTLGDLPATVIGLSGIESYVTKVQELVDYWAETSGETMCRSLRAKLQAMLRTHVSQLQDEAVCDTNMQQPAIRPLVIENPKSAGIFDFDLEPPFAIKAQLRDAPEKATRVIHESARRLAASAGRLRDATSDRRLLSSLTDTLDESVQQLCDMVQGFFQSVQVYRSAILSMNARDLAERAGIVQAIEEVEKTDIPGQKKDSWVALSVDRVFPERREATQRAETRFAQLHERLTTLQSEMRRVVGVEIPVNIAGPVDDPFVLASPKRDSRLLQLVQECVGEFNEVSSSFFQKLADEQERQLQERREQLKKLLKLIAKRKLRRIAMYFGLAFLSGSLIYAGFYFWHKPFEGNWTTVILAGLLADTIFSSCASLFACITDKSKFEAKREHEKYRDASRSTTRDMLGTHRTLGSWSFVDDLQSPLKAVIAENWTSAVDEVLKKVLSGPFEKAYESLVKTASGLEECRSEYLKIAEELSVALSALYERREENLTVLAKVSAEIRDEAILPSMTMLEEFRTRLGDQRSLLENLELSF